MEENNDKTKETEQLADTLRASFGLYPSRNKGQRKTWQAFRRLWEIARDSEDEELGILTKAVCTQVLELMGHAPAENQGATWSDPAEYDGDDFDEDDGNAYEFQGLAPVYAIEETLDAYTGEGGLHREFDWQATLDHIEGTDPMSTTAGERAEVRNLGLEDGGGDLIWNPEDLRDLYPDEWEDLQAWASDQRKNHCKRLLKRWHNDKPGTPEQYRDRASEYWEMAEDAKERAEALMRAAERTCAELERQRDELLRLYIKDEKRALKIEDKAKDGNQEKKGE